MRTKRGMAKEVEDKTEENPVYAGRRQVREHEHPFLHKIPRERVLHDEQERRKRFHGASGVFTQIRDERPRSPQPGPSGFSALADPGFGQGGGPRNFVRDFADEAKRSQASKASQYWPGSRARLRALEALAFLTVKYAFSHFPWYFFFKFLL